MDRLHGAVSVVALAAGWIAAAAQASAAAGEAHVGPRPQTGVTTVPTAIEDRVARVRAVLAAARNTLPRPGPCCSSYAQWFNFPNFPDFPNFLNFPNRWWTWTERLDRTRSSCWSSKEQVSATSTAATATFQGGLTSAACRKTCSLRCLPRCSAAAPYWARSPSAGTPASRWSCRVRSTPGRWTWRPTLHPRACRSRPTSRPTVFCSTKPGVVSSQSVVFDLG
jgi:hypothetical protein